ncbi:MAG TPA: spore germination protein GerW family protein [Actinomycetes bacterium]
MDIDKFLGNAKDTLTVRRVFGEPYEKDGVTVIPAARVAGGGGAGSGQDEKGPQGEGGGFGMNATPAGAFVIRGGEVRWRPAVDPNRVFTVTAAVVIAVVLTRGWVLSRLAKAGRTGDQRCE